MIIDYRAPGEAPKMGRNLFVKQDTAMSAWGGTTPSAFTNYVESSYSTQFNFTGISGFEVKYLQMDLTPGQQYTFAFDFTNPGYSQWTAGQGIRLELRSDVTDVSNVSSPNVIQTTNLPYTAGTTRQTFTFTAPNSKAYICLNFGYVADGTAVNFTFANFKMEFGPTATAWTAAPEDSPNLLLNSAFLTSGANWVNGTLDPQVKYNYRGSYTAPKGNLLRQNAFANVLPNTTYTLSIWAKWTNVGGSTGEFGPYVEAGLSTGGFQGHYSYLGSTANADWQRYTLTFTTPATNMNGCSVGWYFNGSYTSGQVWISEPKLEAASVATDWTPAPQDSLTGQDRPVLARADHTIVDWNDSLSLTATIGASQPLSQSYDPNAQTYVPDYTVNNQVFTLGLFKANSTTDITGDGHLKSVTWYRSAPGYPEIDCSTDSTGTWSVSGKTLTRKTNLSNEYGSMQVRVVAVYTDPVSSYDITVQAMTNLHIAISAGGLTQANIVLNGSPTMKNNKPVFVQSDDVGYGRNLLINSSLRTNTNSWSKSGTVTADTTDSYPGMKIVGALNTTQCVSQSVLGKLTGGETYTMSGWVKVDSIVKGTTNFNIMFYTDAYYNNAGTSTWWGTGAQNMNTTAVGWQYYTWTFTVDATKWASTTSFNVYMYTRDFTGTVWFRDLKLEKGTRATDWSLAPEDRPVINEAAGQNNWIWRRYNNPTHDTTRINPSYSNIQSLLLNDERLVTDGATLYYGTEYSYYYGYLGTAVYVPVAGTIPISFDNDDTATVYVNNQLVYTQNTTQTTTGANATTLNLIAGWNTLEILYYEIGGNDGIWNFATTQQQIITNAAKTLGATNMQLHSYPANVNATLTADGWYRILLGANTTEILQNQIINVLQGSTYTESFLFRTDSTDLTFSFTFYDPSTGHHLVTPTIVDMGNGVKKAYATYTMAATQLRLIDINSVHSTTGTYMDFSSPKLELGSTATPFSLAPADVAPSILKTHVQQVNCFYAAPFESYLQNLTATATLWRASVQDATNVSYQWYKKNGSDIGDGSVELGVSIPPTTDQDLTGWTQLTGSSPESGYNQSTLVIPGTAVNGTTMYKCVITDTLTTSSTYNQSFYRTVAVTNIVDPLEIRVTSTIGNTFLNGQGSTMLIAGVFQNGKELDFEGTKYTYTWYKYLQDGTQDATWNSNTGYKTGKRLTITSSDVLVKGTFAVQVQ